MTARFAVVCALVACQVTGAAAESGAAQRALDVITRVRGGLRETSYQHATEVRERDGVYRWDCSGMVSWILARSSPRALRAVGGDRPVARDYYDAIAKARTVPRRGAAWQRIERIEDARPGDVFAWPRPEWLQSKSTGHVGFVLARPERVTDWLVTVRILDATALPHADDTRAEGESGLGEGTLAFVVDAEGRGTAYGWFGAATQFPIATPIVIGRLLR